jgi:hypothetical protein
MARGGLSFTVLLWLAAACGGGAAGKPAESSGDAKSDAAETLPQGGLGLVGKPRPEDAAAARKLADAVAGSKLSLARGLALAESKGRPIAGEFQLEGDKLELWVYVMKGDEFFEVQIDPESASIVLASRITGDEPHVKSPAMAGAKVPLRAVVERVAAKNPGLSVLSAFQVAERGHPTVTLNLVRGEESHFVTEDVR